MTLAPGIDRILTDRFSLLLGPSPFITSIQRVRGAPDGMEAVLAEVRAEVKRHDHTNAIWSLTDDLQWEQLRKLGLDEYGELTAMAMAEPPEPGPAEVAVAAADTIEDYTTAHEVEYEGFGYSPEVIERSRAGLAEGFRLQQNGGPVVTFLARLDGVPAGAATGLYAERGGMLLGATTLPPTRKRGVYRALVRARWDEAMRRGTPAIATHAGPMSEPILRRLGFEEVCAIRRLRDPA